MAAGSGRISSREQISVQVFFLRQQVGVVLLVGLAAFAKVALFGLFQVAQNFSGSPGHPAKR